MLGVSHAVEGLVLFTGDGVIVNTAVVVVACVIFIRAKRVSN